MTARVNDLMALFTDLTQLPNGRPQSKSDQRRFTPIEFLSIIDAIIAHSEATAAP
jgi:hypothetical protein